MGDEYSIPFCMGVINYNQKNKLGFKLSFEFHEVRGKLKPDFIKHGFPLALEINMGVDFNARSTVRQYLLFAFFMYYDEDLIQKVVNTNIPAVIYVKFEIPQPNRGYYPSDSTINTYLTYFKYYYKQISYYQTHKVLEENDIAKSYIDATKQNIVNLINGKQQFQRKIYDSFMSFNNLVLIISRDNRDHDELIEVHDEIEEEEEELEKRMGDVVNYQKKNVQKDSSDTKRLRVNKLDNKKLAQFKNVVDEEEEKKYTQTVTQENALPENSDKRVEKYFASLTDPISMFIRLGNGYVSKKSFACYSTNEVITIKGPYFGQAYFKNYIPHLSATGLSAMYQVNDFLTKFGIDIVHVFDNQIQNGRLFTAAAQLFGVYLELQRLRNTIYISGHTKVQINSLFADMNVLESKVALMVLDPLDARKLDSLIKKIG